MSSDVVASATPVIPEDEEIEEAADICEGRLESDRSAIHRPDPIEYLDGSEYGDEHGEDSRGAGVERALPGDEEMMTPGEEPHEGDADGAHGDGLVPESVLSGD